MLAALVVWRFQFLIRPLVLAAILAYLLNPLVTWLALRTKLRQRSGCPDRLYQAAAVIAGGVAGVGLVLLEQITRLRVLLPNLIPDLVTQTQTVATAWSDVHFNIGPYAFSMRGITDMIAWDAVSQQVQTGIQPLVGRGGLLVADLLQGTLNTLGLGLPILVVSIYLSIDQPKMGSTIRDIAQQPGYDHDVDRLMHETVLIWNAYLRGQVILAIIIGVVVALSLSVLGVANSLALGLISGLLEFLPVIGPVLGAAAAILVAMFQASNPWGWSPWIFALVVLGVMIAIQQLENNLLVPRVVGQALDLHPIAVMVSVLMGSSLAGLLGAVLAAPVAASLKLYGVYVWRKMLDLPPFAELGVFRRKSHGRSSPDGAGYGATCASYGRARPDEHKSLQCARLDFARSKSGDRKWSQRREVSTHVNVRVCAEEKRMIEPNAAQVEIYPYTFRPVFKDYPWGGRNLAGKLGRQIPEGIVAESWDIAAHPNGTSAIRRGPLAGQSLDAVQHALGERLVGRRNRYALAQNRFPLLVKLLDAQRWLSVQVHPQDTYALAHEGEFGKTEMWVVLYAEPGAELIFGFEEGVNREVFAQCDCHRHHRPTVAPCARQAG